MNVLNQRSKISVRSLSLRQQIEIWIEIKTPEETQTLLRNQLELVFNKDGLLDLMLYLVKLNRCDLFETLLNSGDICLFYSSVELNQCYLHADCLQMKNLIKKSIVELNELYPCDVE